MASKWVKMKFLELGVNRKVVGNFKGPKCWSKKLSFPRKSGFVTFYIYNGLTSCNVSEKTNDGKYENFLLLTDGTGRLTDGAGFIRTLGES